MAKLLEVSSASMNCLNGEMRGNKRNTDVEPEVMKEPLSPDALAKLRKQRWKKVNMIVSQSRQTGNMAHWKYGRGLRNRLMKVLPAKFLEKKMMEVYELD
ncbi:MAG: hypothetical protein AB8H12_21000 [Lewinella sp.]